MASKLSFSYLEWRPEGADPAVNGHLQRRWERLRREKTKRRGEETTRKEENVPQENRTKTLKEET